MSHQDGGFSHSWKRLAISARFDGAGSCCVALEVVRPLADRDVDYEPARGCAVPVVLFWLKEHAVARTDDLDRTTLALASPHSLGDEDRLAGGCARRCARWA
jgi:hypothetical protein